MLKLLKSNRDMSVNEVKLTLAIEDPRARERRESMGIEVRRCWAGKSSAASCTAPLLGEQLQIKSSWMECKCIARLMRASAQRTTFSNTKCY